jgi:glutamate racemase
MIGIFDSGFGGLTILKGLTDKLPQYDYIYLGDSARAPYGNKSDEVIFKYTQEAVDFLHAQDCRLVIVACNTASTKALRKIQQEHLPGKNDDSFRVLGVTIPICEAAAALPKTKTIGVIGTKATITSGVFEAEMRKINPDIRIISRACPLLVPLIEEGWQSRSETKRILKYYLRPLKENPVDALLLGCTHYPLLLKQITAVMPKRTRIINTPEVVANKLADYLNRHPEINDSLSKSGTREYYTTDNPASFKSIANRLLKEKLVDKGERVELS